ncbi:MAG: hypothetical protein MUF86_16755, partial [Akkermansiaceae bacterium]|nr:hypothetical protein [Akkermansiaceae bacterium]
MRLPMELFLIDATGPFFRNHDRKRVNWSKIPFTHLDTATDDDWAAMEAELEHFTWRVVRQGYNAVSLDDLAHLAPHPLHEPEIAARIRAMRARFTRFFNLLRDRHGLRVYLTSDVLPLTPAIGAAMGGDHAALEDYYHQLVCGVLDDFPQLSGLILRVGESDGNDVRDPIRTRLFLRNAAQANRLLRRLLPEFERRGRDL